jgi:hypothetical protein
VRERERERRERGTGRPETQEELMLQFKSEGTLLAEFFP